VNKRIEIVRRFNGGLRFRSAALFKSTKSKKYKFFLENVVSINGIQNIEMSPVTRSLRILYDPAKIEEQSLLNRLTAIVHKARKHSSKDVPLSFHPMGLKEGPRAIHCYDNILSSWQINHSSPGRLRVSNSLLYRKRMCLHHIEEKLMKVPGIERVSANAVSQSVLILYQEEKISRQKILALLQSSFMEAVSLFAGKDKIDSTSAVTTTSLALAIAGDYLFPPLIPFNTALLLYSAKPTFDKAKKNLFKRKKFGIEILDAAVTLSCLATGQIFAAALMVFLVNFGRNMLNKPSEDSKKLLSHLIYKVPRFAWLVKGEKRIEIHIEDLKPGDRIVLEKGDIVPADGVIYQGNALLEEQSFGHILPVKKNKSDLVFAAAKVLKGRIFVEVKTTSKESSIAKLKDVLLKTSGHKRKVQHLGEKFQEYAVLPTLGMSLLGYGVGGFDSAMAVITTDYGTGLKVMTPMAFLSTLGMATREQIFIKEVNAFERLADVDTVILRKNPVLDQKALEVKDVLRLNGLSHEELLGYAAAGQNMLYSPLAQPLVNKAKELNINVPRVFGHNGTMTTQDGSPLLVGNDLLMASHDIKIPSAVRDRMASLKSEGSHLTLVALDQRIVGAVEIGYGDRFLAADIIQELKKRGIQDMRLTSLDKDKSTQELAHSLGIQDYYDGLSVSQEADLIHRCHKNSQKVAVISEAHSPSPIKADVFISLDHLANIETNPADIILQRKDFSKLPLAWDISKKLQKTTQRTVGLIAVPTTLCICGSVFGILGFIPVLLINAGVNFVVTLSNTIPLYRTYEKELQEEMSFIGKLPSK